VVDAAPSTFPVLQPELTAIHPKEETMEHNNQPTDSAPTPKPAAKLVRWILAGGAMLLIGFTIYSAVMRKFGSG